MLVGRPWGCAICHVLALPLVNGPGAPAAWYSPRGSQVFAWGYGQGQATLDAALVARSSQKVELKLIIAMLRIVAITRKFARWG